jgi:hypothetical protein
MPSQVCDAIIPKRKAVAAIGDFRKTVRAVVKVALTGG